MLQPTSDQVLALINEMLYTFRQPNDLLYIKFERPFIKFESLCSIAISFDNYLYILNIF